MQVTGERRARIILRRTGRRRLAHLAATTLLAAAILIRLASGPACAAEAEAGHGQLVVSYRSGEFLYDDEQTGVLAAPPALGVQYGGHVSPDAPGAARLAYEGYLAVEPSPGARGGLSLRADWSPPATSGERRYSVATALSTRPATSPGLPPERAWDLSAALHEGGPGGAGFEAGGQVKGYLDRLVGRDYRQASAYLGTRVTFAGILPEPGGPGGLWSYLDPGWLGGFASLLRPPAEPGAEAAMDLPAWYEAAAIMRLPDLPDGTFPETDRDAGQASRAAAGRLTVTARHTETKRTYLEGEATSDWSAGESVLELRQTARGRSTTASFSDTLKQYPEDPSRTYRLQEGQLEYAWPAGAAQLQAAAGFRVRAPLAGDGEAYRQDGASLACRLPWGKAATLRVSGDWRWRRYDGDDGRDYLRTTAEAELAWQRWAVALSCSDRRSLGGGVTLGGRRRLALTAGVPLAAGQKLEGGLAWEQSWGAPEDGVPDVGPVSLIARVQWTCRL